jgi:hypothetical protein
MRTIILLVLVSCSVAAAAQTTPDSLAVSRLYSSSWTLTEKYTPRGMFHRLKKAENFSEVHLTIYKDEIHTDIPGGTYQICSSRHRNQNEFWLDCKQADQFIYRVISMDDDVLVIDVLVREKGKSSYRRASRNYYKHRAK